MHQFHLHNLIKNESNDLKRLSMGKRHEEGILTIRVTSFSVDVSFLVMNMTLRVKKKIESAHVVKHAYVGH